MTNFIGRLLALARGLLRAAGAVAGCLKLLALLLNPTQVHLCVLNIVATVLALISLAGNELQSLCARRLLRVSSLAWRTSWRLHGVLAAFLDFAEQRGTGCELSRVRSQSSSLPTGRWRQVAAGCSPRLASHHHPLRLLLAGLLTVLGRTYLAPLPVGLTALRRSFLEAQVARVLHWCLRVHLDGLLLFAFAMFASDALSVRLWESFVPPRRLHHAIDLSGYKLF